MTLAMLVTMMPAIVLADDETPITTPATITVTLGANPTANGANFKEAVERNKLKNSGVSIDVVVSKLKACNVKLSKAK